MDLIVSDCFISKLRHRAYGARNPLHIDASIYTGSDFISRGWGGAKLVSTAVNLR